MSTKPDAEELLGQAWLKECLRRLAYDGLSLEEITSEINRWIFAVVSYHCYLMDEGVPEDQRFDMVRSAQDTAKFDLQKFPKVKPDR